ncbi:hypothetical protein [Falsiroseomonas selenitidurans]|uniref:Transmembrane protein n=1 Tax=Falsiroseomonas selenitidurans TaxID=2716335 RepID=A0ABX1E2Z0_9PROT|nr:hypothetical protein [Falsiroseomonas selenitidurans]NKC31451.1 hypothetical protein [Falsiroseomonas selenitidurans]
MSTATATLLVEAATLYAAIGVGVGLAFLLFGLERFSPAAAGSYAHRALLLPGLALLWPLVAWRWLRDGR